MAEGAANDRRIDSKLAHCPQRFTTCRLTCLQQTGIGRVVPQGAARRQFKLVDEGGALIDSVVDPKVNCALASDRGGGGRPNRRSIYREATYGASQ